MSAMADQTIRARFERYVQLEAGNRSPAADGDVAVLSDDERRPAVKVGDAPSDDADDAGMP